MLFNPDNQKPRKRSYYPFSKNYPSRRGNSYDIGESRTRRKRELRNRRWFYFFMAILFVVVFIVAYVSIALSRRPIDSNSSVGKASEFEGQFKALYMPDDALSGGIAFDLFESKLKETKSNAVVIDFKKPDGKLTYPSKLGIANDIQASDGAYINSESTINLLKSNGYKIIARIYCYEDVLASSKLKGAAVTELDGTTVWLDDSAQRDGNPWLNPYSDISENYLLNIVGESVSVGADAVILSSVTFPYSNRVDKAFFAGEAESIESRNSKLHSFVEKASQICGDVPVMVYMNVDQALNGSVPLFGGGMFDSGALFDVVDYRESVLNDGFSLGNVTFTKETVSQKDLINTATPVLTKKLDENYTTKAVVPIINNAEYVSVLQELGINNYILIQD